MLQTWPASLQQQVNCIQNTTLLYCKHNQYKWPKNCNYFCCDNTALQVCGLLSIVRLSEHQGQISLLDQLPVNLYWNSIHYIWLTIYNIDRPWDLVCGGFGRNIIIFFYHLQCYKIHAVFWVKVKIASSSMICHWAVYINKNEQELILKDS